MPLDFKFLGDCHNVALALHQLTHLPLCVLYGVRNSEVPEEGPELVLIHVGVIFRGTFVDELGIQSSPEVLLQEFVKTNPPYSQTEIFYFDSAEDPKFLSLLAQTEAHLSRDKVDKFMEWAKHQPQFKVLDNFQTFS